MKIKRFVAKTMREAIRQVRQEQGEDAVILSNRRVAEGVEVVAATDYDAALAQQALHRPPPAAAAPADDHEVLPEPTPPGGRRRTLRPSAVPASAAVPPPPAVAAAPLPATAATPAAALSLEAAGIAAPAAELAALQRELGNMRRLLEEQLSGLFWNELKRNQPVRVSVLRGLAELGLDADLARSIADQLPPDTDAERARFLPLGLLARSIPIAPPDPVVEGGIFALVGPTGVGKTTTIAKLAARFAQRNRPRDIALVTLDHYRIGAQEQLFSYGRLLGVPVHAVAPDEDLGAVLDQLSDCRLVLVDTAGMSQRDKTLQHQIHKLRQLGARVRSYVVLAANAANPDEVVRKFGGLKPAGCVLTKVDEAERIGAPLSAAIRHALPLAYVADGQRVPEDLHLAHADRLVLRATQLARGAKDHPDEDILAWRFASGANPSATIHA
ncbi:MAG: flagellar biosynthesis protein FlhF [Nevskia sp.]|nr:flagellar biosynthesis protein FlhF [Nevskia sp.]